MRERVKESGKSEGLPVMGRTEIDQDNITSRESGQTSARSFMTRKLDQTTEKGKADDGRAMIEVSEAEPAGASFPRSN